ncbi:hypothetical protein JOD82_002068 [Paenibacillus sp. 1182]|uniref:hypothetical protein n=1 Tax=Paenibacillus sp. 1182 TaxID=2806565 RepID=UPI001AE91DE5|nr:hypothetical protein [Paenibacillus sp. 1182]MBP1309048.1 hypothetical protein [Paenibacillus sp. 1182]
MERYEIRKLWATVDENGDYVDIFDNVNDVKEQGMNFTQGYGVFDNETNLLPDDAQDFHYDLQSARDELRNYLTQTNRDLKSEKMETTIQEILNLKYMREDKVYNLDDLCMFNMLRDLHSYDSETQQSLTERSYVRDHCNDSRSRDLNVLLYRDRPFAIYQYMGRGNVENEVVFNKDVYEEFIRDSISEYLSKRLYADTDVVDVNSPYVIQNYNMAYFEIIDHVLCANTDV